MVPLRLLPRDPLQLLVERRFVFIATEVSGSFFEAVDLRPFGRKITHDDSP